MTSEEIYYEENVYEEMIEDMLKDYNKPHGVVTLRWFNDPVTGIDFDIGVSSNLNNFGDDPVIAVVFFDYGKYYVVFTHTFMGDVIVTAGSAKHVRKQLLRKIRESEKDKNTLEYEFYSDILRFFMAIVKVLKDIDP